MPMQRTDEAWYGHGAEQKRQGFFGLFLFRGLQSAILCDTLFSVSMS